MDRRRGPADSSDLRIAVPRHFSPGYSTGRWCSRLSKSRFARSFGAILGVVFWIFWQEIDTNLVAGPWPEGKKCWPICRGRRHPRTQTRLNGRRYRGQTTVVDLTLQPCAGYDYGMQPLDGCTQGADLFERASGRFVLPTNTWTAFSGGYALAAGSRDKNPQVPYRHASLQSPEKELRIYARNHRLYQQVRPMPAVTRGGYVWSLTFAGTKKIRRTRK